MSEHEFSHLQEYEVKGKTAQFDLPFVTEASLTVVPANQSNRGWFNAITERNAKNGTARKLAKGKIDAKTIAQNRVQDRDLFPKFVVVGWDGIFNSKKEEVPFSKEACVEFIKKLPDWIMDDLRAFAATSINFLDVTEPDEEDIIEQAGN